MPVITLTTDFGLSDHYVAAMKGAVLKINPEASIVDITHLVTPHNIREGAFMIASATPYFPENAIHVGVVDPGVGGERRALLIETENAFFIGPDNGLFSLALEGMEVKRTIELTSSDFFGPLVSQTFHGRDIFAPVAAHLSLGRDPSEFGDAGSPPLPLKGAVPVRNGDEIAGEVVHIDRFGNIITNIRWIDIETLGGEAALTASFKGSSIILSGESYSSVAASTLLALQGSSGFLEIAKRGGDAGETLAAATGDEVSVGPLNVAPGES